MVTAPALVVTAQGSMPRRLWLAFGERYFSNGLLDMLFYLRVSLDAGKGVAQPKLNILSK
jgi:hypothetical protein